MKPALLLVALVLILPMVLIATLLVTNPTAVSDAFMIPGTLRSTIRVHNLPLTVLVADTETSLVRGLSGTESLPDNHGLLMVFPEDGYPAIWMKDMRYAIDIVWLDRTGAVVDIAESVVPASYPAVFTPRSLARFVLEVPAGFADIQSLKIGDALDLGKLAK